MAKKSFPKAFQDTDIQFNKNEDAYKTLLQVLHDRFQKVKAGAVPKPLRNTRRRENSLQGNVSPCCSMIKMIFSKSAILRVKECMKKWEDVPVVA